MAIGVNDNSKRQSILFGYHVQTSLVGKVIPVVYGRQKISGNVIWVGNWLARQQDSAKGLKAKTSQNQFSYSCAFLISLCQGPIQGVYRIWSDKDEYAIGTMVETYTVPTGGGTFQSTISAKWVFLNIGVTRADTYSHTANDYGSPGSTTLSGTQQTPMEQATTSPGAGQYVYSLGPNYGNWQFSAADAGKVMTITYSYMLPNALGISGTVESVSGDPLSKLIMALFIGTQGQQPWGWLVQYAPNQVLGYTEEAYVACPILDLGTGGVIPNYGFEVQGRAAFGGNVIDCNPADVISDMLTNPLDGVLGWVSSTGSSAGTGIVSYSGTCNTNGTAVTTLDQDFSAVTAGMQININGTYYTVSSVTDTTHIVLTSSAGKQDGVAWVYATTASYSQITGQSSYLPASNSSVGLGNAGELYTYCAANGLFFSLAMDSQKAARQWINDLLKLANADCFWSEGVLKFRTYGDTTAIGNGHTFTPNTAPIYELGDEDLLVDDPNKPPIDSTRKDIRDAKNQIYLEWIDRAHSYAQDSIMEEDFWAVQTYGRRPENTDSAHSICLQSVAVLVATTMVRRSVYIDGGIKPTFKLPAHFARVEPMDVLVLPDQYLGWDTTNAVRVIAIEEDDNLGFKVEAEPFPWSVSGPTLYPKQTHTPIKAGFFADPGPVNAPQFVPLPPELTQGNEYVLGIAISGSLNWGGATVHVSTDGGNSYSVIGRVSGPATMGTLTATLPAAADPDGTDTLAVDLVESFGGLESYTKAQADALESLILVDNELMAYETAALTATFQYNLTYLRRGAYDTNIAAHASGAQFCVVDSRLFQWQYPASVIGTTLYFKFTSVNAAGRKEQDISQVNAYQYFLADPREPFVWSPGYVAPLNGDAYYPTGAKGPASFGLQPIYGLDAQGNPAVSLQVKGQPPINSLDESIGTPSVVCVPSNTGGFLPAGTYIVALSARNSASSPYSNAPYSDLILVTVGGTGAGSIAVTVTWGTGNHGGDLYIASMPVGSVNKAAFHFNQSIADGVTSATITAFDQSQPGGPDQFFSRFGIIWQAVIHAGVWAQQVQSVTSTTVTIASYAAGDMTTNQWAGYTLSLLAKYSSSVEVAILNMPVSASSASSGNPVLFTLTIGTNSAGQQLPDLTTLLAVGDLVVMRPKATFTATSFSEPNYANAYYPNGATGVEKGHLAVVMTGADAGDVQTIASVGVDGSGHYTVFNLAGSWKITPSAGDLVLICAPSRTPEYPSDTFSAQNASAGSMVVAQPSVQNLQAQTWLFRVRTEDATGSFLPDSLCPARDLYLFGSQGTRTITSNQTALPTDGNVICDTTVGRTGFTFSLLPLPVMLNQTIMVRKSNNSIGDGLTVDVMAWTGGVYNGTYYPADTINGLAVQTLTDSNISIQIKGAA